MFQSESKTVGAADCTEYREAAGATIAPLRPPFLFLSGLQHLTRLAVDEMNPPASGTRHGFVAVPIPIQVTGTPALHLFAGSWAAVGKWNHGGANDNSPTNG